MEATVPRPTSSPCTYNGKNLGTRLSQVNHSGPVHTTPEEFENEGRMKQDLSLKETRSGKPYDYRSAIVFEKPTFSNSSTIPVWRAFLKKLRFRDGLVWTVGVFRFLRRTVDAASLGSMNKHFVLQQRETGQ